MYRDRAESGKLGHLKVARGDEGVGPGTYYLIIGNKFSAFSDKYVSLEVDLSYSTMETH
jgi:hypothetical protein